MNFTAKTTTYSETGYFSRLVTDYLDDKEFLKNYYAHPVSFEGIAAAMHDRENHPVDRKLLSDALTLQYSGLDLAQAVKRNIDLLLTDDTFTVTTAHQPAIFTGTLFFIYKILHTIKTAEALSARFPEKNFVPVFYMGSEDADLEELGHIFLDNEKLAWETRQTGSVGRMKPEGLENLIHRIEGEFAGHPHGPELIGLLKTCYLGAPSIQQATLNLLNHLFGSYGLIVLIPDQRMLKAVMESVFRDDLIHHKAYEILDQHIAQLSKQYPVQANPREINLFYLTEDIRERLEYRDGKYHVLNTTLYFTSEQLENELQHFPERFSPNVILRGLFQETILPNIAFVGGGGEMAYWLELKPLFDYYQVPYPVLILRNSYLLIRKAWAVKMKKSGLSAARIFNPEEKLMDEFVKRSSNRQLDLNGEMATLRGFYESVKAVSGTVDKTLVQHVGKLEAQALKKLGELEKKMLRAEKKLHAEGRRKIHEIREALFPLGNLQERIENFIPWFAEYGTAFFDLIYEHSETVEQKFVILEEEA